MKILRKPIFLVLLAVLVLGGVGAGLYFTGNLPIGAMGGNDALAATDGDDSDKSDKKDKDKPEILPIPVEIAVVEGRGIAAYYRAASVIEADRLVDVPCRADGRVRTVLVEEGNWVDHDQVLAELENDREKIQLRKAELTLADKQRQLDRSARMQAEELISQQEYDDVESAFKMAEAERDLAKIALEETRIRSPFAGQVTERTVVLGQQVALGIKAFTLGDFSPLRVRVHLPENVARKVAPGQRVLVTPEAASDPLLLDGSNGAALVGGFVKVRITTDAHHDALAIPKIALVEEGSLRSVFVAEADTVRKVEIETGLYDETHVEVLEGLFAGDFIVTMGQGGLRTGTLIKALNGEEVGYKSVQQDASDPAKQPETITALVESD